MRIYHDDRGQALILAVLAAAIGAVTLSGLLMGQQRLLAAAREDRGGEAAAQAAGAVVADEHLAFIRALRETAADPATATSEERSFLAAPGLSERALAAARELAQANRVASPARVEIEDSGREISITVEQGGLFRVSIEKARCCRR